MHRQEAALLFLKVKASSLSILSKICIERLTQRDEAWGTKIRVLSNTILSFQIHAMTFTISYEIVVLSQLNWTLRMQINIGEIEIQKEITK